MCKALRECCQWLRNFCIDCWCYHGSAEWNGPRVLDDEMNGENSDTSEIQTTDTTLLVPAEASRDILRTVQVVIPLSSEATEVFFEVFRTKLDHHGLKAVMTDVKTFNADEECSDVVMVICNNYSRLKSNVDNALVSLKKDQNWRIFLVILHVKPIKDLPVESSKNVLDNGYNNVVDIAFTTKDGIYDCKWNKHAFQAISDVKWGK